MLPSTRPAPIRWWPAYWILGFLLVAFIVLRAMPLEHQFRNIALGATFIFTALLLLLWWSFASRSSARVRLTVLLVVALLGGGFAGAFRFRGVTGDFIPIVEPRWQPEAALSAPKATSEEGLDHSGRPDFPQYLGPNRDAILTGWPALARDWSQQSPQVLWRQPIGVAWSGFAIVGNRALTFEQRGEDEVVVCLDVRSGKLVWEHAYPSRFESGLGGTGPRSTPTVVDGRVYTFGAMGTTTCLDLKTGARLWQRTKAQDAPKGRPEWGYACSPLVVDGQVIISMGQSHGKSLFSFRAKDGEVLWSEGDQPAEYSSPMVCTLAGVRQIVMFNMIAISAHDPATGAVLWEYPWGIRQPCTAQPVPVSDDEIIFSSAYGVGCERLRIRKDAEGKLAAERVWKSMSLKSKMAAFILRDGFLYGLDDGILTCVDARDGSRKWKNGRYGHGQLLWVGDLLLVTAESGDIVLLAPTPEAANEVAKYHVFDAKTWNPPALSGDLLLMRTDQEMACVRLPLAPAK